MSVETIALVLHHSRSSSTDRLVLVGIANHDGDGGAWPTVEKLMKYTGRSERTVQDCIKRLVDLGELKVTLNAGGNRATRGDRRPNLYEVLVACPSNCDGTKEHRLVDEVDAVDDELSNGVRRTAPRSDGDGVRSPARGAVGCVDGVRSTAPEPSLEPSSRTTHASPASPGDASKRRVELRSVVMLTCYVAGRKLTRSAQGALGRAVADLLEVDATPDDVRGRAAAYRRAWPNVPLTPTALAARWDDIPLEASSTEAPPGPAPSTPTARAERQGAALARIDITEAELDQHLPTEPDEAAAFRRGFLAQRRRTA